VDKPLSANNIHKIHKFMASGVPYPNPALTDLGETFVPNSTFIISTVQCVNPASQKKQN